MTIEKYENELTEMLLDFIEEAAEQLDELSPELLQRSYQKAQQQFADAKRAREQKVKGSTKAWRKASDRVANIAAGSRQATRLGKSYDKEKAAAAAERVRNFRMKEDHQPTETEKYVNYISEQAHKERVTGFRPIQEANDADKSD